MKPGNRRFKEVPLEIVGSTKFGRYPKVSVEQTWNMIISDGWLVDFAGYKKVQTIDDLGQGRGIYSSSKFGKMFVVINEYVYYFDSSLSRTRIGTLETTQGDVYIEANNEDQVAFSDGKDIWIYNNTTSAFSKALTAGAPLDFRPGYITFQNERFISADLDSNNWRLSAVRNGLSFPNDAQHIGELETKSDSAQAAIRMPGKGNMLLVFGRDVTEQWYDTAAQLFPYQRSTSYNIDYGCLSPATIASGDKFVVWLGINEKSGAAIMLSTGGETTQISTDGINFQLAHLKNPSNSYGFIFKQDGHVLYVITFPDDNISYLYDFNTKRFFNISDPDKNKHIAKRVAFFNNEYYFVSFIDGDLYQLSSLISDGDGDEIPRIRMCKNLRLPDQSRFVMPNVGFTIEQGEIDFDHRDTRFCLGTEDIDVIATENLLTCLGGGENFSDNVPRIDLSISKDGGVNFGSNYAKILNRCGKRANRCMWWRLGMSNDTVFQFRFWSLGRFVATNGIASIYQ